MRNCIKKGIERFVAGALAFGVALCATGGQLAWHVRAPEILGTPTPFMGVAYGQGMFVAVVYDGRIAISRDGANWQVNKPDIVVPWIWVAFAAGRFVAGGGPPDTLVSSIDGTNWVQQPFPDIAIPTGLSSTGDRFWLCVFSGPDQARSLFTSTTGTNWVRMRGAEEFFSTADGRYYSVAYGGGVYVSVGWDTSLIGLNAFLFAPTIIISRDRTNWVTEWTGVDPADVPTHRDGTALRRVTYGDNLFVAVAASAAGKNIWWSSDGTNWTYQITSFPDLRSVAYGDGVYVAVGGYDEGLPGVILTSTDGKQWTAAEISSTNYLSDVTYGQNTFVAVGSFGQIFQSDPVVTLKTAGQPGQLLVRCPVGRTCTIEATESLGETNVWQTVGAAQITNNPSLWTDYTGTNGTNRFYRAKLEP